MVLSGSIHQGKMFEITQILEAKGVTVAKLDRFNGGH